MNPEDYEAKLAELTHKHEELKALICLFMAEDHGDWRDIHAGHIADIVGAEPRTEYEHQWEYHWYPAYHRICQANPDLFYEPDGMDEPPSVELIGPTSPPSSPSHSGSSSDG